MEISLYTRLSICCLTPFVFASAASAAVSSAPPDPINHFEAGQLIVVGRLEQLPDEIPAQRGVKRWRYYNIVEHSLVKGVDSKVMKLKIYFDTGYTRASQYLQDRFNENLKNGARGCFVLKKNSDGDYEPHTEQIPIVLLSDKPSIIEGVTDAWESELLNAALLKDQKISPTAINYLTTVKTPTGKTKQVLESLSGDPDNDIAASACSVRIFFKDLTVFPASLSVYEKSNRETGKRITYAIEQLHDEALIDVLTQSLAGKDHQWLSAVCTALRNTKSPKSIPALMQCVDIPNPSIQRSALYGILQNGGLKYASMAPRAGASDADIEECVSKAKIWWDEEGRDKYSTDAK